MFCHVTNSNDVSTLWMLFEEVHPEQISVHIHDALFSSDRFHGDK